MARLCREFDISRKTGYKIFSRYKDCGVEGLTDRSRRPYRHARSVRAIVLFVVIVGLPGKVEGVATQPYQDSR
jgi:hypothetical protein